jgi:hypothetical protein
MTGPKTPNVPREPQSGEPDAGSRGPDTWPFEVPGEQRERVVPDPARGDRARDDRGDVERPARPESP